MEQAHTRDRGQVESPAIGPLHLLTLIENYISQVFIGLHCVDMRLAPLIYQGPGYYFGGGVRIFGHAQVI